MEKGMTKEEYDLWRETAHTIVDTLFDRVTFSEDGKMNGSLSMGQGKPVRAVDYIEDGETLTRFESTGETSFTLTYRPLQESE